MRPRFTYANVMATLAMFVALGGGAYALKKNSVKSIHVANESLKSADLKNGKAVRSPDVKDDSLKGADIDEASLGQVPDAATLDGFARGDIIRTDYASSLTCDPGGFVGTIACNEIEFTLPLGNWEVMIWSTGQYYFDDASGTSVLGYCQYDRVHDGTVQPRHQLGTTSDDTDANQMRSMSMAHYEFATAFVPTTFTYQLDCVDTVDDPGDLVLKNVRSVGIAVPYDP